MGRCCDTRDRLIRAVRELVWTRSYGTTTVDSICAQAGVQKGSFYHFFDSKSDLALAALQEDQARARADMDRIFSPLNPPLDRIRGYCRHLAEAQECLKRQHGHVLGCPLFALGSEVTSEEPKVRSEVAGMLEATRRYLESAIREAQAAGELPTGDSAIRARCLHAFIEGSLTQARIANDTGLLHDLPEQAIAVLRAPFAGADKKKSAAAS